MDITNKNFKETLPLFLNDLSKSEVVSIDLEMTGIRMPDRPSENDTPMEYFSKSIKAALKYKIIQFGMSLFIPDPKTSPSQPIYVSRTYNFYLFPRNFRRNVIKETVMDSDAMDFLISTESIDFNNWINGGLAYYDIKEREKIRTYILGDKFYDILSEIRLGTFKDKGAKEDELKELAAISDDVVDWFINGTEDKAYVLNEFHNTRIQQILLNIKNRVSDFYNKVLVINVPAKDEKPRHIVFRKESVETIIDFVKKRMKDKHEEYNETIGFSLCWESVKEIIREKGITVVLHNSFLDLLYICSHLEGLDENMLAFKETVNKKLFPILFDTKLLSARVGMEKCHLGKLWEELLKSDMIKIRPEIKTEGNGKGVLHNAGYDAFVTGCAFLYMRYNVDISPDMNRIRLHGKNCFSMDMANLDNDIVTKENVFVLLQKKTKKTKNKDKAKGKGDVIDMMSEFGFKDFKGYSISNHRFDTKIQLGKCMFLKMEEKIPGKVIVWLEKHFDVMELRAYYKFLLEIYTVNVFNKEEKQKKK